MLKYSATAFEPEQDARPALLEAERKPGTGRAEGRAEKVAFLGARPNHEPPGREQRPHNR